MPIIEFEIKFPHIYPKSRTHRIRVSHKNIWAECVVVEWFVFVLFALPLASSVHCPLSILHCFETIKKLQRGRAKRHSWRCNSIVLYTKYISMRRYIMVMLKPHMNTYDHPRNNDKNHHWAGSGWRRRQQKPSTQTEDSNKKRANITITTVQRRCKCTPQPRNYMKNKMQND